MPNPLQAHDVHGATARSVPDDRTLWTALRGRERRAALRATLDRLTAPIPPLCRLRATRRLRHRMTAALGYKPNLRQPRSFNEKLAWRMLNDRNPLIPLTTDKIAVREWVAARVGPEILVPLYGAWDRADEIDWKALPGSFTLKANHGWNMNLLVPDKTTLQPDRVRDMAAAWLRNRHSAGTDEWGYSQIKPRLLAEELMLDEHGTVPADFKFDIFHGRMRLLGVHTGRFGQHRTTFFDEAMRPVPISTERPAERTLKWPTQIDAMIRKAEQLGAAFDYVRVDLYLHQGSIRFGKLTHYTDSACFNFARLSDDYAFGDMWQLS